MSSNIQVRDQQSPPTQLQKIRAEVGMVYKSQMFQVAVAFCIFANFVVMAAEAEMRPTTGSLVSQTNDSS
jgi:hypothetical protein